MCFLRLTNDPFLVSCGGASCRFVSEGYFEPFRAWKKGICTTAEPGFRICLWRRGSVPGRNSRASRQYTDARGRRGAITIVGENVSRVVGLDGHIEQPAVWHRVARSGSAAFVVAQFPGDQLTVTWFPLRTAWTLPGGRRRWCGGRGICPRCSCDLSSCSSKRSPSQQLRFPGCRGRSRTRCTFQFLPRTSACRQDTVPAYR